MKIIKLDKSIIPACDISSLEKLKELVSETCDIKGIGAYKIGFELVIPFGMDNVVNTIRAYTDLPIIYDHQKAGTDTPHTGEKFSNACKRVDAVIFFPQSGPVTEEAWIKAAQAEKLGVIVGGEMTHEGYLETDGGFIKDEAPQRIYEIAAKQGVTDFVVPGNKPEKIQMYRNFLEEIHVKPIFYAPGFVAQGGQITDAGKAAGDRWHAIVGRGIYQAKDINKAAKELTSAIK